jgi:hypothetical protein
MEGISEDRIILEYETKDPVDLELLTASFSGLASQYRKTLERRGFQSDETNVRLFITDIVSGSIEAEIGVAAVAFLNVFQFMDYSIIFTDFTMRIKRCLDYFVGSKERPHSLDIQDCRDIKAFISAVRSNKGASLRYRHARFQQNSGKKETLIEFSFDSEALDKADRNIDREIMLLEQKESLSFKVFNNVLLRWHQTNKDDAKTAGLRSSDKAVIEEISDRPLSVFFPPGAEILKRHMINITGNPFRKDFVIDVHVQYVNDKPKQYTVLDLHDVRDLDDEAGASTTKLL